MHGHLPVLLVLGVVACAQATPARAVGAAAPGATGATCGQGKRMTVHFYDVGQGLAALVDLPDGRHVLVDTGNSPRRAGCGMCAVQSEHLLRRLSIDLRERAIDVLWLTHQPSEDVGGAPEVLGAFRVGTYVDNGRDVGSAHARRARQAAEQHGVQIRVVDPEHSQAPIADTPDVKVRAVLPAAWPLGCEHDANECSIGLRFDFCASSVLFMGDAEQEEEAVLDPGGPVSLLQVAHHGSETSTTPAFVVQAKPKYAVISVGRPGDGPNRDDCHPRALIVERLTQALGGAPSTPLEAFDGERCDRARASDWVSVAATDRLWATERDGDVVLTTTGDGVFVRQSQ